MTGRWLSLWKWGRLVLGHQVFSGDGGIMS